MSTVSERVSPSEGGAVSMGSREFHVRDFDKISTALNGTIRVSYGDSYGLTIRADDKAIAALDVNVRDGTLEIGPAKTGSTNSRNARSLASHLLDLILKRGKSESHSIAYSSQYMIDVTTPRLRELIFGGKARLTLDSQLRDAESVKIVCGGVSAVSISAVIAPSAHLVSAGTASLVVDELKSDSLDCRISGTASIRPKGETDTVSARISGTGSLDAANLITSKATLVTSGASNASIHTQKELEVTSSGACAVRYLGNPEKTTTFSGVLDCSPLESEHT